LKTAALTTALVLGLSCQAQAGHDVATVKSLGAPQCAVAQMLPDRTQGKTYYPSGGDKFSPEGRVIARDPYASWPALAGHGPYSAIYGIPEDGARGFLQYSWGEPQTSVSLVIGTVDGLNKIQFVQNNAGSFSTVAAIDGADIIRRLHLTAPFPNVHIRMTLTPGLTFNTLIFKDITYGFEIADVDAVCN
jgi:hypothetical protein